MPICYAEMSRKRLATFHTNFGLDPNKVKARCPYDRTTISPSAIGDELIGLNTDQGLLTCAGAGSGKTVNLIGNLVHYQGSVAALDPKNDLAEATARWRQDELGHHNIQTTLRYGHLAPSHLQAAMEKSSLANVGLGTGSGLKGSEEEKTQVVEIIGAPDRNRTCNPWIRSPNQPVDDQE